MNTRTGSPVTLRCSVSKGATVIHPEAWRKGPGWLWDWGQREANEKSMLLWHINLSPNFITGIRCQEKSVVWRCLFGPYWLSWPLCALSWWRKWAKMVSCRKIITDNENSRTLSVVAGGPGLVSNMQWSFNNTDKKSGGLYLYLCKCITVHIIITHYKCLCNLVS